MDGLSGTLARALISHELIKVNSAFLRSIRGVKFYDVKIKFAR